jgi:hypothetical protein
VTSNDRTTGTKTPSLLTLILTQIKSYISAVPSCHYCHDSRCFPSCQEQYRRFQLLMWPTVYKMMDKNDSLQFKYNTTRDLLTYFNRLTLFILVRHTS